MVNWSEVLGELITQVMRIILPVGIALILKWAGELWIKLKQTKPEIAEILEYAVAVATRAAEQRYGSGHGEEKKEYAIQFVTDYLAELGLKVNVDVIADAIEAEVFSRFTQWKMIEERNDTAE